MLAKTQGQETFSYYSKFNGGGVVFYDTYATDSCFYVIGIGSMEGWERDVCLFKFRPDGTIWDEFEVKDTLVLHNWTNIRGLHHNFTNNPVLIQDGAFSMCTNSTHVSPIGNSLPTYIRLHPDRKLLVYDRFDYPADSQEIAGNIAVFDDSSNLYLTNRINYLPGGSYNTEFVFRKVTHSGTIDWEKSYLNGNRLTSDCITTDQYKSIYIAGNTGNFGNMPLEQKTFITKFDSLGNFIKYYEYPDSLSQLGVQDIFITQDQGIVFASNSTTDGSVFKTNVIKLDSNFQEAWKVVLDTFSTYHRLEGISPLKDGSFLVYGRGGFIHDTLPQGVASGWLSKISAQGDSLWTRNIFHSPSTRSARFYGGTGSPDGGFFLVGLMTEYINGNKSGAWWVKLDSMGCLVPGCHLKVGLEDQKEFSFSFSLFPNPAKAYLFVHIQNPQRKPLTLQLLNSNGQILQNHVMPLLQDITQGIAIDDLASGIYLVRVKAKEGHFLTKKLILD